MAFTFLFQLAHKFNKLQQINGGSDAETELPPLPFDIEEMDKLVQESAVRALESKLVITSLCPLILTFNKVQPCPIARSDVHPDDWYSGHRFDPLVRQHSFVAIISMAFLSLPLIQVAKGCALSTG